mmetsp:Transcript_97630/g.262296  ORF Transcript_97630/g.262296 Transcript_97630/m.262296 type:complete len:313 (-) Transcript_97630:125-1063(-)
MPATSRGHLPLLHAALYSSSGSGIFRSTRRRRPAVCMPTPAFRGSMMSLRSRRAFTGLACSISLVDEILAFFSLASWERMNVPMIFSAGSSKSQRPMDHISTSACGSVIASHAHGGGCSRKRLSTSALMSLKAQAAWMICQPNPSPVCFTDCSWGNLCSLRRTTAKPSANSARDARTRLVLSLACRAFRMKRACVSECHRYICTPGGPLSPEPLEPVPLPLPLPLPLPAALPLGSLSPPLFALLTLITCPLYSEPSSLRQASSPTASANTTKAMPRDLPFCVVSRHTPDTAPHLSKKPLSEPSSSANGRPLT